MALEPAAAVVAGVTFVDDQLPIGLQVQTETSVGRPHGLALAQPVAQTHDIAPVGRTWWRSHQFVGSAVGHACFAHAVVHPVFVQPACVVAKRIFQVGVLVGIKHRVQIDAECALAAFVTDAVFGRAALLAPIGDPVVHQAPGVPAKGVLQIRVLARVIDRVQQRSPDQHGGARVGRVATVDLHVPGIPQNQKVAATRTIAVVAPHARCAGAVDTQVAVTLHHHRAVGCACAVGFGGPDFTPGIDVDRMDDEIAIGPHRGAVGLVGRLQVLVGLDGLVGPQRVAQRLRRHAAAPTQGQAQ